MNLSSRFMKRNWWTCFWSW